ncbi:MAG: VWA domain-containing protein, partial [Phycisphaerae bacterium]
MTFLAPTSAILAAAVVLPLLVAMYLLKLRRRPLRVSSILLWEKFGSDIQVNVPLARPRASWLLLLHVLIAAALIAAVGRPAIPGAAGSGGKLIVVIDRSASMSALDSTRDEARITRLDEAKERAAAAIQQAAASSAVVAVVTFGSAAQVVREFSPDAAQAVRAVREIAPSDQPGNFAAAADVVRALVSSLGESESGPGVDVVLFSDGVFEASADSTEAGGPAMRLVRVGAPPANTKENLGVVSLAARRLESDLAAVEVFARR